MSSKLSVFFVEYIVLKGNGEVGAICSLEVLLHAVVEIPAVRTTLASEISYAFKGLPHAILGHLFLGLPELLKFACQNLEDLAHGGVVFAEMTALKIKQVFL